MKSFIRMFSLSLSVVAVATLAAISISSYSIAAEEEVSKEPINSVCPIMDKPVREGGGEVVWNKTTIGFCCKGCIKKFEALSDLEKAKELNAALEDVEPINATCPIMEGGKVKPKGGSSVWKGKKIGFCCPGCLKKWEAKSAEEKNEFVSQFKEEEKK